MVNGQVVISFYLMTKQISLKSMFTEPENEHTSPPPPLPDDTDNKDDSNANEDQGISDEDENEGDQGISVTQRANKQKIFEILQILKGKFSYVTKVSKGRTRFHLQCNYICQKGPLKGQKCNFYFRFSSKRTNYSHIHSFDLSEKYCNRKEGIQSNQLTDILVDMVSTTNISFWKACAPQFRHLLNSCIEYGFNLLHRQEEMRESYFFQKLAGTKFVI